MSRLPSRCRLRFSTRCHASSSGHSSRSSRAPAPKATAYSLGSGPERAHSTSPSCGSKCTIAPLAALLGIRLESASSEPRARANGSPYSVTKNVGVPVTVGGAEQEVPHQSAGHPYAPQRRRSFRQIRALETPRRDYGNNSPNQYSCGEYQLRNCSPADYYYRQQGRQHQAITMDRDARSQAMCLQTFYAPIVNIKCPHARAGREILLDAARLNIQRSALRTAKRVFGVPVR